MANCMKEVAGLLGVEVGEVFEVYIDSEYQGRCRFTKDRVEVSDNHCWYRTKAETLEWLLNGTATIIKLPWKPKIDEVYYIPRIHPNDSFMWLSATWKGNKGDNKLYQLGLVCKTREEAIAMTKKMIAGLEKKQ